MFGQWLYKTPQFVWWAELFACCGLQLLWLKLCTSAVPHWMEGLEDFNRLQHTHADIF